MRGGKPSIYTTKDTHTDSIKHDIYSLSYCCLVMWIHSCGLYRRAVDINTSEQEPGLSDCPKETAHQLATTITHSSLMALDELLRRWCGTATTLAEMNKDVNRSGDTSHLDFRK